mmetsp:Transcript_44853/g.142846  ORF Transcript_44853/g.142846 Transcript_44853/m.142846 type:complete len:244 (+) Transcript_44853:862-1593(+)
MSSITSLYHWDLEPPRSDRKDRLHSFCRISRALRYSGVIVPVAAILRSTKRFFSHSCRFWRSASLSAMTWVLMVCSVSLLLTRSISSFSSSRLAWSRTSRSCVERRRASSDWGLTRSYIIIRERCSTWMRPVLTNASLYCASSLSRKSSSDSSGLIPSVMAWRTSKLWLTRSATSSISTDPRRRAKCSAANLWGSSSSSPSESSPSTRSSSTRDWISTRRCALCTHWMCSWLYVRCISITSCS